MSEEEIRTRVRALCEELDTLRVEASKLFLTGGWIYSSDEKPPVGKRVLGLDALSSRLALFELKENGLWLKHRAHPGDVPYSGYAPKLWMAIPPIPGWDDWRPE